MYCPQCGATNEETAGTCASCGLDLEKYRQQWQTSGVQTTDPQGQQVPAYQQPPYQQDYQRAYQAPPYQTPQYRPLGVYGVVPRIPNYLAWAIVVLVLCFWPTGIAAVVYASQVDNRLALGDIAGARESSRKAKMWCWITFGIGVGLVVLSIAIVIIVALAASAGHGFTY